MQLLEKHPYKEYSTLDNSALKIMRTMKAEINPSVHKECCFTGRNFIVHAHESKMYMHTETVYI